MASCYALISVIRTSGTMTVIILPFKPLISKIFAFLKYWSTTYFSADGEWVGLLLHNRDLWHTSMICFHAERVLFYPFPIKLLFYFFSPKGTKVSSVNFASHDNLWCIQGKSKYDLLFICCGKLDGEPIAWHNRQEYKSSWENSASTTVVSRWQRSYYLKWLK